MRSTRTTTSQEKHDCWTGDPQDLEQIDAAIAQGVTGGIDLRLTYVQLVYISPFDFAPAAEPVTSADIVFEGSRLRRAQYPSITA